jgi:hypothetical protein
VYPEGLGKLKKFIHLIGSQTRNFRLVAYCHNHYATVEITRPVMYLWIIVMIIGVQLCKV